MNERTKQGLNVLEVALLLGLLGDALLRATPWGLNVLLWTVALVCAAFLALPVRWRRNAFNPEGRWLALPVIFFAAALAWRDSPTLNILSILALLAALALSSFSARGAMLRLGGLMEYALGVAVAGFDAAFGFFPLVLRDVRWKEVPHTGWSKHAAAVLRGLFIAAPLVFVFLLLFVAADAVFEKMVSSTFRLNMDQAVSHILLAVLCAWLGGGFLRGMLMGNPVTQADGVHFLFHSPEVCSIAEELKKNEEKSEESKGLPREKSLSLGIVEIGIVLGLLDVLFLSFVIVQVRYLFGGAALAQATTGLTYAEYARRGFFELVTVAALVLPLLLAVHWLLRKENPLHERIFRVLAGVKVALLFVIMSSAIVRMRVYQSGYGLTELRFYTTAFMLWLALVFVWFVLTVLRGQRERFACGGMVAGFLVVAALHFINPDALIVRANMEQMRANHGFDASYASSLSADAVPALVEALPALGHHERCTVSNNINRRWPPGERADWRTWNWSRAEAYERAKVSDYTRREEGCREDETPAQETAVEVGAVDVRGKTVDSAGNAVATSEAGVAARELDQ